jgi:hypothetical protein
MLRPLVSPSLIVVVLLHFEVIAVTLDINEEHRDEDRKSIEMHPANNLKAIPKLG